MVPCGIELVVEQVFQKAKAPTHCTFPREKSERECLVQVGDATLISKLNLPLATCHLPYFVSLGFVSATNSQYAPLPHFLKPIHPSSAGPSFHLRGFSTNASPSSHYVHVFIHTKSCTRARPLTCNCTKLPNTLVNEWLTKQMKNRGFDVMV